MMADTQPKAPVNKEQLSSSQRMLLAVKEARTKLEAAERAKREPIVIVGMGCRFPGGAINSEAYWDLLANQRDAITEVPPDRWDIDAYYDPDPDAPLKMSTRYGGFLESVDQFDASFFNISPREALSMDPQQRLLLEVAWEALENAAWVPEALAGSRTGVFVGVTINDYGPRLLRAGKLDTYFSSGNVLNAVAGRLAYTLGLQGPCMAVDTACSSSLVAIHLACQSLRNGECRQALAGGVNIILAPENTVALSKARMMSADGRCKTFDASADGFVRGEGCGVLVLKRLSDAVADDDRLLALIRGSAVNQDGASSGFTVPNRAAQEALIQQALAAAKLDPNAVNYVEAHGTGTSLGDPIEVKALASVLRAGRTQDTPLLIGSVKTNLGHLESAAGVAGVMKVVLALQHQQIPAHLHLQEPNPYIPWADLPVKVTTTPTPWLRGDQPRIAGISSFGASGTNAHVVLEEAPLSSPTAGEVERPLHLLTLSAKTTEGLSLQVERYRQYLTNLEAEVFPSVCHTASVGRTHFGHRLSVAATSGPEAAERLANWLQTSEAAGVQINPSPTGEVPKVVFLFTGQGSQHSGMGHELYQTQPTFRQTLEDCQAGLEPWLDVPLLDLLFDEAAAEKLNQTAYTQPALFALEYALAQLWLAWGVRPAAVMGHSVGEYVAACVAGVFSLEDGLRLIAERGRLMQALPTGGGMVSILASEQAVQGYLKPYASQVAIAAINGPTSIVISGPDQALTAITTKLEQAGIKYKPLVVSHAFHSPLMEPILAEFKRVAQPIHYQPPRIKLVSNLTGQLAAEELATADYWCRHIRQPVQFVAGMQALYQLGYEHFLEVGPKPILLGMGRSCIPATDRQQWLPSLRPPLPDWQAMLDSLSQLYVQGANIDWVGFDQGYSRQRLALPTYAFQRQRYWVEVEPQRLANQLTIVQKDAMENEHPLLGRRLRSALKVPQFEAILKANTPIFLADHQVAEVVILPATAYCEIALAAGISLGQPGQVSLESVTIQQPLVLSSEAETVVQCVLTADTDTTHRFEILSAQPATSSSEEVWTLHATGQVLTAVEPVQSALETPPTPPANAIGSAALYQQFHQQGFNYGPAFQGVTQVWRTKTGVIGQIQLPAQLVTEANCYILHPALLDACFQILAAASEDNSSTDTPFLYLPVAIQALRLHRPAPLNLWCRTENLRLEASGQQLQTNLVLFDESGTVIVEVVGLTLQRVNRQALMRSFQPNLDNWLYRIDWQALDALTGSVVTPEDRWLVFVDSGGLGEALVKQLESLGATCLRVVAGTRYRRLKKQTVVVNPSQLEDFQRLVADYLEGELSYRGIIHLWGAAGTKTLTAEVVTALQSVLCGSVLYLVQALLKGNPAIFPQLWLVSRGSQLVAGQAPTQPQAGSLWGLGRVLMLEHPDLRCRCLDLAPQPELDESEQLLIEITAGTAETQLAYRQGQRYGARLVRYRATQAAELGLTVPTTPYQVRIREYGIFENLQLVAAERQTPGPDQVEIAVRAVGLNFRDVLNALGMLQSFTEAMGVIDTTEVPFGGECAGIVTAVGDHVRHLAVGDEVIAAQAIGSLSSHVVVPAAFVVPKPATLSYEAAATIPTAFLTAYYGLYHQAQLQAGERVLVHAAAGGVGQAAVQISQWLGAEVWGTASEPKWPVLKQMGVTQVFNSRNLEFAEQVATLTQAQGVDVVLNSLNGDFIPATLSTLGSRGRFVEIGKLGIWSAEQVAEARPDVTYLPFDLLDISIETPTQIRTWLQELLPLFEQGKLTPLPHRIFSIENLVEAFRYMAQAKHVGKVVIGLPVDSAPDANQAKQTDSALAIRAQGTYLVTGGFGALGQQVARWLVQQGARHLVLTGRRIPTDVPILAELEQQGAIVQAVAADISQISAVAALIAQIEANEPPLRGIFHTAGVLADSMLAGQTWERFEQVMAPKIAGSWLLHEQTQGLELDCFVFFSSVSAVVGSPGQANYAAANAFMDTLAAYRWGLGLPALSINWGPWSESGMAAALQSRDLARWAAQGVGLIEPAQGMSLLGQLLAEASYAQTIVLPVDWGRYLAQIPPDLTPPLLESFTQEYQLTEAETPAFLPELQAATPSQRRPLLLHHVQANLAKVLGLTNPEALDPQQGLAELGMDSLMAIELRNRLQSSLGCPVPATLAFDYPTIAALVDYLAGVLNLGSGDDQGGEDDLLAITAPQTEPETNQADLDELSDSEAEALLMDKLDSMRY